MRKVIQAILIVVLSLLFWIFILESVSAWWIDKYGDPLDKAKNVLVIDSVLGWRQKPNFNGNFLNISLKTNEVGLRNKSLSEISNSSKNILVLGPSSTFGWGVEDSQTYSSLLEKLLRSRYHDVDINVINAGQIGYSSWQGFQFYNQEELRKLKVDVLIVAYGVNDVDRYRFFYPSILMDKEEFVVPKNAGGTFFQGALLRFRFVNLLSRIIFNLADNFRCAHQAIPQRRVSNEDFSRNMEKLIQMGRRNKAEVILLSSAFDLPAKKKLNSSLENSFDEYFKLGRIKYFDKQYLEAVAYFKKAVMIDGENSEAYYYLSSCYSFLGNALDSNKMFEKARQLEPKRIVEDLDKLNSILGNIADKNGIILADIRGLLSFPDANEMFVDPIHFSANGNIKIAQRISDIISNHDLLKMNKGNQDER